MPWKCRNVTFDLERPLIMGIVNVTPDSFSDGGRYNTYERALSHAHQLVAEGADIIDIGGESARPGSKFVSLEEELERVIPVAEQLVCDGYVVSVDTSKPGVMREALRVGVQIINDVRAFTVPGAVETVKDSGAGLVVMHFRGVPETMQQQTEYGNVVTEVCDFLRERTQRLKEAGVNPQCICWDPGFGFAKTFEQNMALLNHLDRLTCEMPTLAGLSRKSMIGTLTGQENAEQRIEGSVKAACFCVSKGAHVLRVHDVAETVVGLQKFRVWGENFSL